jgi:hypothetical protein
LSDLRQYASDQIEHSFRVEALAGIAPAKLSAGPPLPKGCGEHLSLRLLKFRFGPALINLFDGS